jgi:hypothetical protein
MNTQTTTAHAEVLAAFLGCNVDELSPTYDHHGLQQYDHNGNTYAVGTEEEAAEALTDNIREMLWAFNAAFIVEQCDLPTELAPAIAAFQGKECEGANDALLALVEKCTTLERFAEAAEQADGRGHFLNPYDGNEKEQEHNGKTYFIYQTN